MLEREAASKAEAALHAIRAQDERHRQRQADLYRQASEKLGELVALYERVREAQTEHLRNRAVAKAKLPANLAALLDAEGSLLLVEPRACAASRRPRPRSLTS